MRETTAGSQWPQRRLLILSFSMNINAIDSLSSFVLTAWRLFLGLSNHAIYWVGNSDHVALVKTSDIDATSPGKINVSLN